MRLLQLLSRVAFICNICFLLASFIQWLPHPPEGGLISLIIVMGYLLAILVNTLVNAWVIGLFIARRVKASGLPAWLLVVNFTFFVLLLLLLLINRP